MAQKTLNLGSILSQLLKDANANFTELYRAVSTLQENMYEDSEQAIVYSSILSMVNNLNNGTDEYGKTLNLIVGDNIYTADEDTPDFWISGVNPTSSKGNMPVDSEGNPKWEKNTDYTFGYYVIRVSQKNEITLTDYLKVVDLAKELTEKSTYNEAPSAKVVYDYIEALKNQISQDYASQSEVNEAMAFADQAEASAQQALRGVSSVLSTANEAQSMASGIIEGTNIAKKAECDSSGNKIDEKYATKDELADAGKVKDVKLNGKSVLDTNKTANINIRVNDEVPSYKTDDTTGETYLNIVAQAEPIETNPLEATLTPIQKNQLADYKYNEIYYKAIKLNAKIVVTSVYNSQKQSIITQPIVVTENGVNYIYYLVATNGTEEDTYYYQTIEGDVVGGGGSADTAELEVRIEDLEDYVKIPLRITLEKKTITQKPQSGNVIKDTNVKIDAIIDKINGIEIQENTTLIYEKDEYGTGVLTNENGEPLSIIDSKIRIYAYVDKSNQQTVISRQFYARFANDTINYTVNFPELTFLATSHSLKGSLGEYLQSATLYNHFVELAVGELSYTVNGSQYTAVARLFLNYIDNINTSTLDISEWINSPFITDKTGQVYVGDNTTTSNCAGRIITNGGVIPFGIIESYTIYLDNNDYKITVKGLLSSISGDSVTVIGNKLLSETSIIRHVVVPIKVFL